MKLKKKFILDSYTISDFIYGYEGRISNMFEDSDWDNQNLNEFKSVTILRKLKDWNIKFDSDGFHDHDGQNVTHHITISNPKTGEYYIGSDRHNLVMGWEDVEMNYYPAPEPKPEMVTIPKTVYDDLIQRRDWLDVLESHINYCNFSEYGEIRENYELGLLNKK